VSAGKEHLKATPIPLAETPLNLDDTTGEWVDDALDKLDADFAPRDAWKRQGRHEQGLGKKASICLPISSIGRTD
jgi:hypothetical protein